MRKTFSKDRARLILISIMVIILFNNYIIQIGIGEETEATVVYVSSKGTGEYLTIQQGIDQANDGDTVFVYNGTYYENIVIDKTLSLIGEDNTTTFINGRDVGNVIKINADGVTIKGFTIQHGGLTYPLAGINCSSDHNMISENSIIFNFYGITLYRSSNNKIIGNIIQNNAHCGIYISQSTHNIIENNSIQNHTYNGIGMYDSSDNNTIQRNTLRNNKYCGVNIRISSFNIVRENIFVDNNIGIHIPSSENTVEANSFFDNNQDIDEELATPGYTLIMTVFAVVLILYWRQIY